MAKRKVKIVPVRTDYDVFVSGVSELLDRSRKSAARVFNVVLTATYWELGRRSVEFEQGGQERAGYGEELIERLASDLTRKFGRGFSRSNLFQIRSFYLDWEIIQTPSGVSHSLVKDRIRQTASSISKAAVRAAESGNSLTSSALKIRETLSNAIFPLSWSHYARLMTVPNLTARRFYEEEAIKSGWSVRQLDRKISTQFYQRLGSSKRKAELLGKVRVQAQTDHSTADELVRDPYILEFLNLSDEYAEGELERAIIDNLENFLVDFGRGFTFFARQRKIRIDDVWYKIDLLSIH
jgi:predicted nuclease of restriction endonuclease-like (RecB) superfamily